jgi:asparagine synthase
VTAWRNAKLVGYTSASATAVLDAVVGGAPVQGFSGDFVVSGDRETGEGRESVIATSVVGARPYYYAFDSQGQPVHGERFFDVVRRAGVSWSWNLRALKSLALLEHPLGGDTLHPAVTRVPSDSLVRLREGRADVSAFGYWSDSEDRGPDDLERAVDAFNSVTAELVSTRPVVSMSAGYDSRAILSGVLRSGRRPLLLTLGPPGASDRSLAERVARDFGLELRTVELEPEQYLEHAATIVELTGGTHTAAHWHTFLYPLAVPTELSHEHHLVGSNGEFARSYYLDKGALSRAVDAFGAVGVPGVLAAKAVRWRRKRYPSWFELVYGSEGGSIADLAVRLTRLSGPGTSALERLDRFYATERVPNFIGNGLALYAASGEPRSPFLDARWLSAARRLRRREKLGSNYHRSVISRNEERLMRYPIQGESPVRERAPAGYWRGHEAEDDYHAFGRFARSPEVVELVRESPHVAPFTEGAELSGDSSLALIDLLITLHFAGEAGAAAASGRG